MKLLSGIIVVIALLIFSLPAYADISIYIATKNTDAHFMLVDYNGKRTGYDPVTKSMLSETKLPFMSYYLATSIHLSYMLQGRFPVTNVPLNMKIILTGTKLSSNIGTAIEIDERDAGLTFPQSTRFEGFMTILDVDQVATYEVAYVPTKSMIFTKVAAPTDLIADITTAGKLNLIGNQVYVTELINKVTKLENNITEKSDDGHDDDIIQNKKKGYMKLLEELTEKYNQPKSDEFVKKEAYDVLKEDLEYIISHIQ